MSKHSVALKNRKQRSVLTDMLPFEVPPTFSNRGFYNFLRNFCVEIDKNILKWRAGDPGVDTAIRLIFGIRKGATSRLNNIVQWGSSAAQRSVPISDCRMDTIPFNFKVAHKLDGRVLSVVHPRNQVQVANFYATHSSLVIYYTSQSAFSIRRPVSVSRYVFFKDKLHEQRMEVVPKGVEEEQHEYEQIGSYFVYKEYRNIHRFFESPKYHRCEKKYDFMIQIDISKCFDSIYTHSIPWSILGKTQTKFHIEKSKLTFPGRFDILMQQMNHQETNGIVIGPEFSRIFAEIILQSIDIELEARLAKTANLAHKVDYEIFRYVDDYFVFFNQSSTEFKVIETLQELLREKKLSINTSKIKLYNKPIITEITVAKERISKLLNEEIDPKISETSVGQSAVQEEIDFSCFVNSNRLIVRYKTVIKESSVEYGDLLNYTFAIIENKMNKIVKVARKCGATNSNHRKTIYAIASILEFAFFAYSSSPKVNHTIRICRLLTSAVDFAKITNASHDLRHFLFKFIHSNVIQMLEKNTANINREIESMYLLISLSQIGKEYWLTEHLIAKHFMISFDKSSNEYRRADSLSYFSITTLLSYMKDKKRYDKLRKFVEQQAISKLRYVQAHCPNEAEALMLMLDLIVCPYVSDTTKQSAGEIFGLDIQDLSEICKITNHWFTAWGNNFDLGKELDAKRSREVY